VTIKTFPKPRPIINTILAVSELSKQLLALICWYIGSINLFYVHYHAQRATPANFATGSPCLGEIGPIIQSEIVTKLRYVDKLCRLRRHQRWMFASPYLNPWLACDSMIKQQTEVVPVQPSDN
jgi:hypothetical protein